MHTKPAAPSPLAVDISTAALMVGISRAQFYRLYLRPGRVRSIKTGGRDRNIDCAELQAAYATLLAELPRVQPAP
jgi:hypothetical protein